MMYEAATHSKLSASHGTMEILATKTTATEVDRVPQTSLEVITESDVTYVAKKDTFNECADMELQSSVGTVEN